MVLYKYQGAGNDFLIADNRQGTVVLTVDQVAALCDRRYGIGADGLMLLEDSDTADFRMVYCNSDGSGGMMCGNGGRCIVAFAADMGVVPAGGEGYVFEAADGIHTAQVISQEGNCRIVRLKMKDVAEIEFYDALTGVSVPSRGCFMDTGTRHYVRVVDQIDEYDVVSEGREIRYKAKELQPIGANVNFIQAYGDGIKVRTYEKGVEDETFACGTGITASGIAAFRAGMAPTGRGADGSLRYAVYAKRDRLSVDFVPVNREGCIAENVHLTGPATSVARIETL